MTHPERIYPEEIAADIGVTRRQVLERLSKRPDFPERTCVGKRIWWSRNEYKRWLSRQKG